MQKAPEVLLGPLETAIATTPCDVVYEEDRVKLKHYTPETKIKLKTPLLLNPGYLIIVLSLNKSCIIFCSTFFYSLALSARVSCLNLTSA